MSHEEMEAGLGLDALVAEKVFGWINDDFWGTYPPGVTPITPGDDYRPPRYSTDITAAWEVVDHLQARGWNVLVECVAESDPPGVICEVYKGILHNGPTHAVAADTVPLAICWAALEVEE